MLESLFSKQVVQPYLDNEFPIFKEAHDDRLFKHVTFLEEDDSLKLRLTAVDHNYMKQVHSSSVQKVIDTKLYLTNPDVEVFRVKSVLSEDIDGISESHWVQERRMENGYASSHNQYRIRGVSDKHFKGDWVYSEIRDFDNDLVVYNMMYDVLDLLLTVRDDQIDYLIDYIVTSTFTELIKDMSPSLSRSIDPEEFKSVASIERLITKLSHDDMSPSDEFTSKLAEQFNLLSKEMKYEFKENLMSSPSEFSLLMRVYKLIDQYKDNNSDFLELLIESFLEDRYEKIVQKTNIDVLLQNDAEIGSYIDGEYKLDIKAELIASISNVSFDDHFVTTINDTVELLSEPIIFESLAYSHDETVERFLRMVLRDIFVPMTALDRHLVELHTELEDTLDSKTDDSIVEFMFLNDDDSVFKFLLLNDVVEALFKSESIPMTNLHTQLLDHAVKHINDSNRTVLLEYYYDEAIKVMMDIGERFQKSYNKEFGNISEVKKASLIEAIHSDNTIDTFSLKESYHSVLKESQMIVNKAECNKIQESKKIELQEKIQSYFEVFKHDVKELIKSTISDKLEHSDVAVSTSFIESLKLLGIDKIFLENVINELMKKESITLDMEDKTIHNRIMHELLEDEQIQVIARDSYYNLFNHYLRTPHKYPILERKLFELHHDLGDYFLWEGEDKVDIALGLMDEDWVLGTFVLGVNTLKGESVK